MREILSGLPRVPVFTARQAGPSVGEPVPDGPILIDYVGLLRSPKMTQEELEQHLRADLEKYAPECQASVNRNSHMNACGGSASFDQEEAKVWLGGFCAHFAKGYKGRQGTGDVLFGMAACAKEWKVISGVSQDHRVRDALVVDFINFVGVRRGVDFGMYVKDL